ncbi:Glu/Leu/Phe/Val family dehydrogenase [Calidifontibacillus erzurumensis]|uniref:Glu/Leu/Phe/Val dehydrogenase n=1 Tax=Calidifontibacillus erzurumensis TaxID=2741433 RepID=A0A8J8KC16_9BACI|nr:Glu/Leu/Phe/Val dehydrogenase [Calidifontibacillus erzurumensis]NSL52554.1 Glu/Leu/Phe/Val dehydrogenase [Calidifontibacillus erzurumensis]
MDIFEEMKKHGHEQLIFNYDKSTGLKAIIAIHDTTLGPALGGCRMWNYESTNDAILDALRLSKGMTYKCAVSGVNYGGGKAVIIGDPKSEKSDELFQAFGSFVETMKGRFYTGTDVGTVGMDFVSAAKQTSYLVGLPKEYGGSGNSAVITAFGVWNAMKATAKEVFGTDSLEGLTIAVQGLGKVGQCLVKHLYDEGAKLIVTDIFEDNIQKVLDQYEGIKAVEPNKIYSVECDIFSPNALGAVINDQTIPQLKCSAIVGAANNVLKEERHGDILHEKGILYAPDYVANAGGLIQVADELHEYNHERAFANARRIYDILGQIYSISKKENIPTYKAANLLVENKIKKIAGIKSKYVGC